MSMFVGCTGLPAKRGGYYSNLNAVEVVPDQGVPPKPSTARRWAEEAPDGFCFTMVASKFLTTKPEQLEAFRLRLMRSGLLAFTRKTRGDEIAAACGQLVGRVQERTRRALPVTLTATVAAR